MQFCQMKRKQKFNACKCASDAICRKVRAFCVLIFLSVISIVLPASLIAQEKFDGRRIALVIGNANYKHGKLANPTNDADAIEAVLKELEFDVTKLSNQSNRQMIKSITKITSSLKEGDLCFFFYAGHGCQVNGANYLVPIDAKIEDETDIEFECLALDRVMSKLENSECSYKVIVLDCCRNNPFRRSFSRNSGQGFSAIQAQPDGTIIAFSTKPGQVASDGSGENSPYTQSLISVLNNRSRNGLELIDVFRSTARLVAKKNGQRPFIRFDGAMDNIFLVGSSNKNNTSPSTSVKDNSNLQFAKTLGIQFVKIPAGRFMMGSEQTLDELFREFPAEDHPNGNTHIYSFPQHQVKISKPFYMSAHEITIGQFRQFVKEEGYRTEIERGIKSESSLPIPGSNKMRWDSSRHFHVTDKYPVTIVSWNDAQAFCKWLSKKLGKHVTLPSQAQWEYACRGGAKTRYSFGDDTRSITHFANVPSRTEVDRFMVTQGNTNSYVYSENVSILSMKGGGNQVVYQENDKSSGSATEIKRLTVKNKSNVGMSINRKFIGPGQQVTIEPTKIPEPVGVYVRFRKTPAGRLHHAGKYGGAKLYFYYDNQEWKTFWTGLHNPDISDRNAVEVHNLDQGRFLTIETPDGKVTLNPNERKRVVRGYTSQYWSDAEDGYPNQLAPVGQFEPNKFGLYDMHGNVWEWCQDGFDLDYSKRIAVDPKGSRYTENYAIRGGCYL